MPEPHILFTVVQPAPSGSPAPSAAWQHLVDPFRRQPGALDGGANGDGAQLRGGQRGQVALKATHGGTSGTDDDDGIDHGISRWLWLCGRAQADGNSCLAAAAATTGGSGHDLRVAASMQTTVNSQSAESTPVSVLKSSWR